LEVESGSASRRALQDKVAWRFEQAEFYTRSCSLALVFVLLGPPWVRQAVVKVFGRLPEETAVVLADWKAFGVLPAQEWGRVRLA
jgi:hypothetical protein